MSNIIKGEYFLERGNVDFIMALGDSEFEILKKVVRDSFFTYSNGYIIMLKLEKMGVIKTEKVGRVRKISLTPRGNEIFKSLMTIYKIVKRFEVESL